MYYLSSAIRRDAYDGQDFIECDDMTTILQDTFLDWMT